MEGRAFVFEDWILKQILGYTNADFGRTDRALCKHIEGCHSIRWPCGLFLSLAFKQQAAALDCRKKLGHSGFIRRHLLEELGHASGNSHILVPQNSVVLQQLGERWGGLSSPAFIQRILIYIYIYVLIKSS